MKRMLAAATCAAAFVAGCNNQAATTSAAIETATETPSPTSTATGWDRVALGLREQQLLSARLLGIDGGELGAIKGLLTGADGRVDRLLVDVEKSDPARFVAVPVQGLTVLTRGARIDVVSTMTVAQLAALPDVPAPTPAPTPTPAN
jgi:hypothetical protein